MVFALTSDVGLRPITCRFPWMIGRTIGAYSLLIFSIRAHDWLRAKSIGYTILMNSPNKWVLPFFNMEWHAALGRESKQKHAINPSSLSLSEVSYTHKYIWTVLTWRSWPFQRFGPNILTMIKSLPFLVYVRQYNGIKQKKKNNCLIVPKKYQIPFSLCLRAFAS